MAAEKKVGPIVMQTMRSLELFFSVAMLVVHNY